MAANEISSRAMQTQSQIFRGAQLMLVVLRKSLQLLFATSVAVGL